MWKKDSFLLYDIIKNPHVWCARMLDGSLDLVKGHPAAAPSCVRLRLSGRPFNRHDSQQTHVQHKQMQQLNAYRPASTRPMCLVLVVLRLHENTINDISFLALTVSGTLSAYELNVCGHYEMFALDVIGTRWWCLKRR